MAVLDDLRRLSELDSIYLGYQVTNYAAPAVFNLVASWYKGRLQQANDGSWIFRSISTDGTVCGFQLASIETNWQSNETPTSGIQVIIPMNLSTPPGQPAELIFTGSIVLQQELPGRADQLEPPSGLTSA